jgi:hypothetical protein
MYITINGTAYPYKFVSSDYEPSGYNQVSTPDFCIYYEGGLATTGCYCNPGASGSSLFVRGGETLFYTNGNGGWWAFITLSSYYQFKIAWSE